MAKIDILYYRYIDILIWAKKFRSFQKVLHQNKWNIRSNELPYNIKVMMKMMMMWYKRDIIQYKSDDENDDDVIQKRYKQTRNKSSKNKIRNNTRKQVI